MQVIDRFERTLDASDAKTLEHVRAFILWQVGEAEFRPSAADDVGLRTYLLELKTKAVSVREQRAQIASLRRFYDWAESAGLIKGDHPFSDFSIARAPLTAAQIRRREEIFSGSAEEREIARLRALNQLADGLNRSSDIQATLDGAIGTLVSMMNLKTAWVFLLPQPGSPLALATAFPAGKFSLACAYGLPPGLEANDRYHLTNPALCHCQAVMLEGRMTRAVNVVECTRLIHSAEEQGDNQGLLFHASVPIIGSSGTLGIINVATEDWQFLTSADLQLLSAVGAQVAIALERASLFDVTRAQRARLEEELQLARAVQESLLPERLPSIPGYDLAADWRSALEMAGDFYDVFPLPDGRWAIVIADVSDKGAAAAMYMAMTRSLLRASAAVYASPAGALKEVNQQLLEHTSSVMFVTMIYAVLDPASHTLIYANAGHNRPMIRHTGGEIETLPSNGIALGATEDPKLSDRQVMLTPGDLLLLYTDGVTDALNKDGVTYDLQQLTAALQHAPASGARAQLQHVLGDLNAFIGEAPRYDDITLFVITR